MSKLILVAVPIGNLEDISIRSTRHIFNSKIIFAEDTRSFYSLKGLLKQKFTTFVEGLLQDEVEQRAFSYREQNHAKMLDSAISILQQGDDIVLVSDAGMPAISDPGFRLVKGVLDAGFEVDVIPGPSAFSSALVISGLATDRFCFLGFLPKSAKKAFDLVSEYWDECTAIVYESPFRVIKTLEGIAETCSKENVENVQVSAISEITKLHQKAYRGSLSEVIESLKSLPKVKGEWVLCFRKG